MQSELIKRCVQRHMRLKPHKIARDSSFICILDQRFTALGLFDVAGFGKKRIKITIFCDELRGRLDADAGDARHIVNRVARE